MCGRYTLTAPDPAALRSRFPIGETVEVRSRYNIAPGDDVLAVTTDRQGTPRGELLHWGLVPGWAEQPEQLGLKLINARIETVAERSTFRTAFERFRCLIPADGFYEWQPIPGAAKQPFHITRTDRAPFAFAGLWSIWHGPAGAQLRSCTILTRPANQVLAALHDRMPVILDPDDEDAWLDRTTPESRLSELLGGLPSAMTAARAVSQAVNDARCDRPECLSDPTPDAQEALF